MQAGGGGGAPSRVPGANGGAAGGGPDEYGGGEELSTCRHCGRSMNPGALVHHAKACTAEKPMKRAGAPAPTATAAAPGGAGRPPQGGSSAEPRSPAPPRAPPPTGPPSPTRRASPAGRPADASGGSASPTPAATASRAAALGALAQKRATASAQSAQRMAATPPPQQQRTSAPQQQAPPQQAQAQQRAPPPKAAAPPPRVAPPQRRPPPSPPANSQAFDAPSMYPEDASDMHRIECRSCGRRFAPEALEKHARVCSKVFGSKRKVYDVSKARVEGTDAAQFARKAGRAPPPKKVAPKGAVPKWKAQSNQLQEAMRNMREVKVRLANGEDIRNIPVAPSTHDPSLVQCPHCGRRFNEKAADRHIGHCATTKAKPNFLSRGTGGSGQGAPQGKTLPRY
ncbi:hypothetical protein FOA52_001842 [Chlamydomonas sp. UWO 241]|nr:hypothetical protein FOA52_001842 [Chlamydomonas sp. UWO 241]